MPTSYDTTINDTDTCSFCGAPAKYRSRHTGKYRCAKYSAQCPSVRSKNTKGLETAHREGRLNTDHLKNTRAWSKGLSLISTSEILKENSKRRPEFLRKRILKDNLLPYECDWCGLGEMWRESPIVLELDHINGDNKDNRIENLRFLCPNCHSQTSTYRGRNTNNGQKKINDETIVNLLKEGYNTR